MDQCNIEELAAMLNESDEEECETNQERLPAADSSSDDDISDSELDRLAALSEADSLVAAQNPGSKDPAEGTSEETGHMEEDQTDDEALLAALAEQDGDLHSIASCSKNESPENQPSETTSAQRTRDDKSKLRKDEAKQEYLEDNVFEPESSLSPSGDIAVTSREGAQVADNEASSSESDDEDKEALKKQMQLMQAQLALMASKLSAKKKKKKSKSDRESGKSDSGSATDESSRKKAVKDPLAAVMSPDSSPREQTKAELKKKAKSPKASKPSLKECNLFDIIDQEKSCGKGDAVASVTSPAPWQRKHSVPSSGYKLSSSAPKPAKRSDTRGLDAKLNTTVEKITKNHEAASAKAESKTKAASFYGNKSRDTERELFGSDSNSDWSDMDGEKNDNLNEAGKEIRALKKKKRVAHDANYDRGDLEKYRDKVKAKNWKSPTYSSAARNGLPSSTPRASASATQASAAQEDKDVMVDPFSGIRVVKPLVSSVEMKRRMEGRRLLKLSRIHAKRNTSAVEGDWVTIGVVAHKGETRMSQNNKQFSVWKLTDLDDCDQVVHLYLFGETHKAHWKTVQGSVIGLLNPSVMKSAEKYASRDAEGVSLTLDDKMKMMLMGTSKDLGVCKSRTKAGNPCHNFINKSKQEACSYHVQQRYKHMSAKRGELSANFTGVTPKNHEKRMFKNKNTTVMYGGRSYTSQSLPSGGARKKADSVTMAQLQSHASRAGKVCTLAITNLLPEDQAKLDEYNEKAAKKGVAGDRNLAFHELISVPSAGSVNFVKHLAKKEQIQVETSKGPKVTPITAKDLLKMHHAEIKNIQSKRKAVSLDDAPPPVTSSGGGAGPSLGRGLGPDMDLEFDLDAPPPPLVVSKQNRIKNILKKKAVANVLAKGGIQKEDPNAVKKQRKAKNVDQVRKKVEKRLAKNAFKDETPDEPASKRSRLLGNVDMNDPQIQALLNKKSRHAEALSQEDSERQEAYFAVLEKKEALEDQMDQITSQKVTAVSCKQCKYRALKAHARCKEERHELIYDKNAERKWYKCRECARKCWTIDRWPENCRKCGSSKFDRTSMLYEKKGPKLGGETLVLRGEERKYVNS